MKRFGRKRQVGARAEGTQLPAAAAEGNWLRLETYRTGVVGVVTVDQGDDDGVDDRQQRLCFCRLHSW